VGGRLKKGSFEHLVASDSECDIVQPNSYQSQVHLYERRAVKVLASHLLLLRVEFEQKTL